MLFLLYINDITLEIQSQVRLFTDDCLIYHTVYSEIDHTILRIVLILGHPSGKWNLMFQNVRFLNVYKKYVSYSMKGILLESVEEHSYFGVTLHHGMS